MLRRDLTTGHELSVEEYRARWNLPHEHPMAAPSYSERRGLANSLALVAVVEHPSKDRSRLHPKYPQRRN